MESLRELYRIGRGPSSSHTMGPGRAAERFRAAYPEADSFQATLYGSLAKTGKGHLTDVAVLEALEPVPTRVLFDTHTEDLPHPNTMEL
ncbi:MAG: serine dehydratase, partial [Acutalibacter sp.]|nr:serine dehydratase [Acutalibacter sp.]